MASSVEGSSMRKARWTRLVVAAGAAASISAATGIVINLLTDRFSWALGAALAMLIIASVVVTVQQSRASTTGRTIATGHGAVITRGPNRGDINTLVVGHGATRARGTHHDDADVVADGAGSVIIDGENTARISTRVHGSHPKADQ